MPGGFQYISGYTVGSRDVFGSRQHPPFIELFCMFLVLLTIFLVW